MRVPLIVGNWKMNKTRKEAVDLVGELNEQIGDEKHKGAEVGVCPPSVYLHAVGAELADSPIGLGAQNMSHEEKGAFTGEISGGMLNDLGCKYVILGHSERRHGMGETDYEVCLKVHAALNDKLNLGLTPIVCVGETLEERFTEKTLDVIKDQIAGSLAVLTKDQALRIVIAYEPVWAIGTGKAATAEQAQAVHAAIRDMLKSRYGEKVSSTIRIQYGGSVKPENAEELLSQEDIDGALVGGASLKADSFLGIIAAASTVYSAATNQ